MLTENLWFVNQAPPRPHSDGDKNHVPSQSPHQQDRPHQSSLQSKSENKIRVLGYCRVSTDMQCNTACHSDAQREEIGATPPIAGWLIEEISWTVVSAKNTDRPAFQRDDEGDQGPGRSIAAVLVTKLIG